jgi:hypothetical protein
MQGQNIKLQYKYWTLQLITQKHKLSRQTNRHRQTDTQTYRHTDIQTHRHTDTQTYRHTDLQPQMHTLPSKYGWVKIVMPFLIPSLHSWRIIYHICIKCEWVLEQMAFWCCVNRQNVLASLSTMYQWRFLVGSAKSFAKKFWDLISRLASRHST